VRGRVVGARVLSLRLARLAGWTCFTAALLTVVSDRHRTFFGRWSATAFAAVGCALILWCAAAWGSWRARHTAAPHRGAEPTTVVDLATLCWGSGYLWATIDAPGNASQVFDLNLFGSSTPGAIVLYWLALAGVISAGTWLFLRRLPARWLNLGLSLVTLTALALLGEAAVRATALIAPETQGFPTYMSALWMRRYVRLNARGFRDSEHRLARIPGTRRILLIGDSFAFGLGIPHTDDRLGEQVVARLDVTSGAPWEVINASHPDRNTLEEIALLDSTIAYRPDLVMLVYVFNDMDYLYPITQRTVLTEAPQTVWQRIHPVRLLFRNSFLFQELYVRLRALRWARRGDGERGGRDPYADATLVRTHLTDLARFVEIARRGGSTVSIVPFDPTVSGSAAARARYESFVSAGLAAGLPIWRVDSAFDGLALRDLRVNQLDGHPNALANRVVAERVSTRVLAVLGDRGPAAVSAGGSKNGRR